MDFFPDLFTYTALMQTLNEAPYKPRKLDELNYFETSGLPGTIAVLPRFESEGSTLLQEVPRGTPGNTLALKKVSAATYHAKSFREDASIMPDEVLNMAQPGLLTRLSLESVRARKVELLRENTDDLLESLRMSVLLNPAVALNGEPILNAQLQPLTMGATQTISFTGETTKLRQEVFNKLQLTAEAALGGTTYSGIDVLCSDGAWAKLIDSPYINKTYLNTPAAAALRAGVDIDMMEVVGCRFIRYRPGAHSAVPTDEAIVIPRGVPRLFLSLFAPADTTDQVGSGVLGGPYYMESSLIDEGKRGVKMTIQTNPIMLCTRPHALRKLVIS